MSSNLGTAVPVHRDVYDFISPTRLANSLNGKVALITGAGRGIGKAIALAFAEAGADVALLARTKSQLEDVASTIRERYGRRALVIVADATDEMAIGDAVDQTERELGPVDVAIANAGVNLFRPIAFTPMSDWWRVMEVNVKGQILVAQEALKRMRIRGKGVIIFNASRAAVVDVAGLSSYCASKAAVVRAAGCFQLEADAEEKDIQFFTIHPGGVATDMTPDALHPDMDLIKPGIFDQMKAWVNSPAFGDAPELSAWSCVFLATGAARELRGRYLDVRYDLEAILNQSDIVKKEGLYELKAVFLGGGDI